MISYAVGFALLLHVGFWGIGLAVLAMPRHWQRFWPVLVFPAGFALQSAVVWIGAYAGLPGTNHYAWPSEIVPLALAFAAVGRLGWRRWWDDLARFGLVWLVMMGSLAVLILPLAIASRGLTSVSLGSCDAPDYAAGARVFMEFAHADRSGFLGLTEVVHIMSVNNFFDFWLRLNHFTPSALMALNGSVLHCAPHETASLLAAVVLATSVPVVFWISRALFGYTGVASLAIATLYGIGPVPWYSMAQVSPAPLLAGQAIGCLTWVGVALWNGRCAWRRLVELSAVFAISYSLILGSYNFILLVAIVPAAAYAIIQAGRAAEWRRLIAWVIQIALPLVAACLFWWARFAGLVERFLLFQTYDFGWRIPPLAPDGWLGLIAGGDLRPWSLLGVHWFLAVLVITALFWSVARGLALGRRRAWLVLATVVPTLGGYYFLEIRGVLAGTNASYDAFKLFTVFYPVLLPAFCWWITLRWSTRLIQWVAVAGLSMGVFAFNAAACAMYIVALARPPLIVDGELRQVRRVEAMPDVASVNLEIPDMWSRLWANEFLLRKPQYFATHTYEGRLNTPLRGEWDLSSGVVRVSSGPAAYREVAPHYWLLKTTAPQFVRMLPRDGWYPEERLANGERWRWTDGTATLVVENPHPYPVAVHPVLDGRSTADREVALVLQGTNQPAEYIRIGAVRGRAEFPPLRLPPGQSILMLRTEEPPTAPSDDERPLAVCVFGLTFATNAN